MYTNIDGSVERPNSDLSVLFLVFLTLKVVLLTVKHVPFQTSETWAKNREVSAMSFLFSF